MRATSIDQFRLPGPTHRTAIYGRTGDGKTVLGTWLLRDQPFDRMPYYVLDFKRDDLLRSIDRMKQIGLHEPLPKQPGLYVVRPNPADRENGRLENFLSRVWQRTHNGLYVDEGFMLDKNSAAWEGILTQGRSLRIPVINLTQRPVWLSRFVTSQADFHYLFPFNDDRDNETVLQFVPREIRARIERHETEPMQRYHSLWFDVENKTWAEIGAAPSPEQTIDYINERLRPRKSSL